MPVLTVPEWLKAELRTAKAALRTSGARRTGTDLSSDSLSTVCENALCPNRGTCFSEREATFLILGEICTRGCRFCAVKQGSPFPPNPDEPERLSEIARRWRLNHIVFTSPARDDLPDGGAAHFASVTLALQRALPLAGTEPLIPDFAGNRKALETVLNADPDVLAHNLETVPRLYEDVRRGAGYRRSLKLLKEAKEISPETLIKSGLMLGLGESEKEVESVLEDMRETECDLLTLGQYLAPSKNHISVQRYLEREEFTMWESKALGMGFKAVAAAPLVRSSFRAGQLCRKAKQSTQERQAK
ncbi:MAG: lipoyl synthase [bacterium]